MTLEEFKNDYNWQHAFHEAIHGSCKSYNSDDRGPIENVIEVFFSVEGENDGDNWLAIVKMDDGKYCKMSAGCDYTGWD